MTLTPTAEAWLGEARRITYDIPPYRRRPRSRRNKGDDSTSALIGTPDMGPGLRQGLKATGTLGGRDPRDVRAVLHSTRDASWLEDESAEDVLLGLAETFRELARQPRHVRAAGPGRGRPHEGRERSPDVQSLRDALEGMHEARARLNDLVMADWDSQLLELHAAALSTANRILREMDLDQRIRRQVRPLPSTRPRLPHVAAPTPKTARPFVPPTPPADADNSTPAQDPEDRRGNPRP